MANLEDKGDWRNPSRKQQLDNRPILSIQELADKLKADLNQLTIFDPNQNPPKKPTDSTKPPEGWVESVVFVNEHSQDTGGSLFSYALLNTYRFPDKIWDWIRADLKKNDRARLKLLFAATDETELQQDNAFLQFRNLVNGGEKERAHNLLIDAVAKVRYSGTVAQLMDELRKRKNHSPGCWWIRYKPKSGGDASSPTFQSAVSDEHSIGILEYREAEKLSLNYELPLGCKEVTHFTIEKVSTKNCPATNERQNLFLKFVDQFMLGGELDKAASDYPYKLSESGFLAYAIPVYEFYGVSDEEWRPAGSLMGWLFLMMHDEFPLPSPENPNRSYLGVRFGVRNFARDVCEYQTLNLLEQEWKRDQKPRNFTLEHFHECSGWRGSELQGSSANVAKLKAAIFERLDSVGLDNGYFDFLVETNDNKVEIFDYKQHDVSLIQYIVIQISDLTASSRSESAEPLILKRLKNTVLPEALKRRNAYGIEIAKRARHIFGGARLRHAEHLAGKFEGKQTGVRENRKMQEFMWAHETRKLSRAIVLCDQPVVRDLVGRHLVTMAYSADGENDRETEANDLKLYWPPPFSIFSGSAKKWMLSLHDFAARKWVLSRDALAAASLGDKLNARLSDFCTSSKAEIHWSGMWNELMIDDTFPNPARKFFTRLWLASFANYFKHRETHSAVPPCILSIEQSDKDGLLLIAQKNHLGKVNNDPEKELGTKDILVYDLLNAVRWLGKGGQTLYGSLTEQEIVRLVRFEQVSTPTGVDETQFITQVPIPRTFFL